MDINTMLKSIIKIFFYSQKKIHLIAICVTILIYLYIRLFEVPTLTNSEQLSVLSGVSIMSSFFLLTLQNINYKNLNEKFTNEIKVSRTKYIQESVVVRSTIFSLSIVTFVLIGVSFILKLLNIDFTIPLLVLINYLFIGIIYTIVLWNYFASKETNSNDKGSK